MKRNNINLALVGLLGGGQLVWAQATLRPIATTGPVVVIPTATGPLPTATVAPTVPIVTSVVPVVPTNEVRPNPTDDAVEQIDSESSNSGKKESSGNTGVIIGAVVGGVIFLALATWVYHKLKGSKDFDDDKDVFKGPAPLLDTPATAAPKVLVEKVEYVPTTVTTYPAYGTPMEYASPLPPVPPGNSYNYGAYPAMDAYEMAPMQHQMQHQMYPQQPHFYGSPHVRM